ncbi:MAG TPA: hypothetical protein VK858_16690, partial [Longimicrobiales bacterium]|nr:hypothetical protein [Longimicrobiales bacterium]
RERRLRRVWRPGAPGVLPALLLAVGLPGATRAQEARHAPPPAGAVEVRPQFLPLPDWLTPPTSMISGLAWHGDDLFLLPQQRRVAGEPSVHRGKLYSIPRAALEAELARPTGSPLPVEVWRLDAPGIDDLTGFEGLEAIAFAGNDVFLTVEADVPGRPGAWILRGRLDPEGKVVRMEAPDAYVPGQSGIENLTQEALLVHEGEVVTIHEANGAGVNPDAVAHAFPLRGRAGEPWTAREMPMTAVEYRVTDATEPDADARFWITNFHFEEDRVLWAPDRALGGPPAGSGGGGVDWIERVVELRITPDGIVRTGRAPIYLEPGEVSRNWEGIARLGTRGLLIVTDKFPSTGLAFVPLDESTGGDGASPLPPTPTSVPQAADRRQAVTAGVVLGYVHNEQRWSREVETDAVGGGLLGAWVNVPTPVHWLSVTAEGVFTQRGGDARLDQVAPGVTGTRAIRTDYVTVSVQPRGAVALGPVRLHVTTGLTMDLLVRSRVDAALEQVLEDGATGVFGWTAGVGIRTGIGRGRVAELEARIVEGLGEAYAGEIGTVRNRSLELVGRVGIPLNRD